jgi:RNA polymerase sigma-70 factor, ECF subfamily
MKPKSHEMRQTLMTMSDNELVEQIKGGDEEAFDVMMTRYRHRVYAVVYHVLWNPSDAEEVAQDVFVQVFRHINHFRGESSFFTWIYRIAMNQAISYARKRQRHRHYTLPVDPVDLMALARTDHSAFDQGQQRKIQDLLQTALSRLHPKYRQVVILRELEGMDVEEVSAILKLPTGTIKSRLFRAHRLLRRYCQPLRMEAIITWGLLIFVKLEKSCSAN